MLRILHAVIFYILLLLLLLVFPTTAQSLVFAPLHVPAIHCSHRQGTVIYNSLMMATVGGRNMEERKD